MLTGLRRAPYWLITWLSNFVLYLVQLVLVYLISYAAGFRFFTEHRSPVVAP